jgi:glycosyltransferase involved in cell wall biosynthesis
VRPPTLSELPPPPPGKTGWPWDVAGPPPAPAGFGAPPRPRISIVTPSYNQGAFIEAAIRSVLLQGYPDLEYGVVDGGSTDGSVEVIRKYAPWLTFWVSEPDRGQSHAINKGFARCRGQVCNWLCTDDVLLPGALLEVAQHYHQRVRLILGRARVVYQTAGAARHASVIEPRYTVPITSLLTDILIPQPAAFVCNQRPIVREDMYYVMDWELFHRILRALAPDQVVETESVLAEAVIHPASKSDGAGEAQMFLQTVRTRLELAAELPWPQRAVTRLLLRRREVVWSLFDLYARQRPSPGGLLRVARRYPLVLTTRPFWGAVRRVARPGAAPA